jgi:hypothetical protein
VANSPVIVIGLSFRDRDGNQAKSTLYCAWATPIADVWALAYAVGDRMMAISDALLFKIDLLYRYTIDDPPEAAIESNIQRKILMLITNSDDEINGIVIPSPGDVFEVAGSYAGIRLDLASAGAIGFADMLLLVDLRTDDNRELGTTLAAGGLAL